MTLSRALEWMPSGARQVSRWDPGLQHMRDAGDGGLTAEFQIGAQLDTATVSLLQALQYEWPWLLIRLSGLRRGRTLAGVRPVCQHRPRFVPSGLCCLVFVVRLLALRTVRRAWKHVGSCCGPQAFVKDPVFNLLTGGSDTRPLLRTIVLNYYEEHASQPSVLLTEDGQACSLAFECRKTVSSLPPSPLSTRESRLASMLSIKHTFNCVV